MGFSIIFTIISLLFVFLFTKRNIKITLFTMIPAITIGFLLNIFVTAYFYCVKPEVIMELKTVEVKAETYNPHSFLLNEDTVSSIEDIDGNVYSFSNKYTPVYESDKSYLEIETQKKISKYFLYSIPDSYKLYLEKDT